MAWNTSDTTGRKITAHCISLIIFFNGTTRDMNFAKNCKKTKNMRPKCDTDVQDLDTASYKGVILNDLTLCLATAIHNLKWLKIVMPTNYYQILWYFVVLGQLKKIYNYSQHNENKIIYKKKIGINN